MMIITARAAKEKRWDDENCNRWNCLYRRHSGNNDYMRDLYHNTQRQIGGCEMQVVKIHHERSDRQAFLFETERQLLKGEVVVVNTRFGEALGQCLSDSFYIDDETLESLEDVACYTTPLQKVIGRVVPLMEFESKWIPVEDYPPMVGERVLVTTAEGAVMEAKTVQKATETVYYNARINIQVKAVAWMPWPKPYKVAENDEQ